LGGPLFGGSRGERLRIHASQLNLNAEVFAADAVARAEAKASAELTRKKLLSFASALAGELNDPADCVVKLRGNGEEPEGQGGTTRARRRKRRNRQRQKRILFRGGRREGLNFAELFDKLERRDQRFRRR